MILPSNREYFKTILLNKFYGDSSVVDPEWEVERYLMEFDILVRTDEDQLPYLSNTARPVSSYQDVFDLLDLPIRGTGKGIELDPIIIPEGQNYLSDFMSKVPLDVMILKGRTGVGGTTLAATDKRKWVVCMSSRNLVKSKSELHKNSIGVFALGHGGESNENIRAYKGNTIFTTWASLERVITNIDANQWSLLIDENHELINKGDYMGKDINTVLRLKDKFRHVTLMSATETVNKDYMNSFDNLDILRINWEEKKEWNIDRVQTKTLVATLTELAKRVLDDDEIPNIHIFINKLDSIIRVIRLLESVFGEDLSDKISIVASSSTSTNIEKVNNIGDGKYQIEDEKTIKRINFYTSTSFSGVDINDDFGDIIMAVHGNIQYTKLDWKIDIPQIIGRIRNPRKGMKIMLLYTQISDSKLVSVDEFRAGYKALLKDANATITYFNQLSDKGKISDNVLKSINIFPGVKLINGKAYLDKAFFMNKRKSYAKNNKYYSKELLLNRIYKVEQGSDIFRFQKGEEIVVSKEIFEFNDVLHVKRGENFKELLNELLSEMDEDGWRSDWWQDDSFMNLEIRRKWAERYIQKHNLLIQKHPFICETIIFLSPDMIRNLGLIRKVIKLETLKKSDLDLISKLRMKINLEVGKQFSVNVIKNKLNKALSDLGVKRSVPSTYIKKVYPEIQSKQSRVDKKVEISIEEYRIINRDNYKKPKAEQIKIVTERGINEDVEKIFKMAKNEGREKVYFLTI